VAGGREERGVTAATSLPPSSELDGLRPLPRDARLEQMIKSHNAAQSEYLPVKNKSCY